MNPPNCDEMDYNNLLIAAQRVFTSTEASHAHPAGEQALAHGAYRRMMKRLLLDSQVLWQEVKKLVNLIKGLLVIDDSTLDKPSATQMALVCQHWSGEHHAVVQGINLISQVWRERECRLQCDPRDLHPFSGSLGTSQRLWLG